MIEKTEPEGIDIAFDGLGWRSFKRSLEVIRPGGLLIAFGFSSAVKRGMTAIILDFIRFKIRSVLPSSRRMTFYSITALRKKHPDWFANDLLKLFNLLSNSKIKPYIWKRMPLSEAKKAHELIEQSKPIGKIVLEVGVKSRKIYFMMLTIDYPIDEYFKSHLIMNTNRMQKSENIG